MEPDQTDSPGEKKEGELDLSSLLNVDFVSRNWEEDRNRNSFQERSSRDDRPRDRRRFGDQQDRRDRRPAGGRQQGGGDAAGADRRPRRDGEERGERPERSREGRRYDRERPPVPQKLVHVQFFPEENAFNALVKALRQSGQTHELFTLARLFLEKPERLMIAISPLEEAGPEAKLFICKIDGAPFLTEGEVYQHVFQNYLSQFAEEEQVEVEAPKGSFQAVSRCPRTGVVLCPPNYHLYPQAVLEHKERYFADESVEAVRNRLELVRDEEVIQGWLDSMTRKTRYRLLPQKKSAEATGAVSAEEAPTTSDQATESVPAESAEKLAAADEVPPQEQSENAESAETPVEESAVAENKEQPQQEPQEQSFESLEELKTWLQAHLRHRIVKTMRQYRVSGKVLAEIPETPVKKSVLQILEEQRRFPLDTANLLRGRFRRLKFDLFKHGNRGINYVCPVKRKTRDARAPWSDSVELLYTQIERLPTATIQTVAEAILGKPLDHFQGTAAASLSEIEKKAYSTLVADMHWLVMEGYVSRFEDGHLEIPKGHFSEEPDAERN